ncbi:hypothetical protein NQ318_017645 [Aromia moschata]|uniref:Sulfotransferase domain-containing protein n=1 Tax=Aromia moschata TaxID=1265417 RepID=A0AAV8Z0T2_9CUCU|nr:hypothetical protein NQ318_017645 [Aromia moschata]
MKMNKHQFSCTIEEQLDLPEKWGSLQSSKVRCDSKLWTVTKYYLKYAEEIYNFTVRPDDVWVVTQPKSGTTLTQEMVWLIANGDYETAKSVPLIKRFPYLEANTLINDVVINEAKEREKGDKERLADFMTVLTQQWITLEQQSDRRFIKNSPAVLFSSSGIVIYVARNPKDVAVSHFKFLFHGADDDYFPEFFDLFINNSIAYTPYWDHVKQGWEHRGEENYCFLFYEDMVKDLRSSIEK